MTAEGLAADVRRLLDLEEIRALRHQYAWCYDSADLEGLVALFTSDAVCDFGPSYGTWTGIEEIRAGYTTTLAQSGGPGTRLHVAANPMIEIDADRATGRWYLQDLYTEPGEREPLTILAVYHDEYRRVAGSWRISRCAIDFRWRKP